MKRIVQNPGGRRYFGEDFMNPQDEILLGIIEPFLADFGQQFVFCGCTLSNNTISQGVVVLNGKACKFEGSAEGITIPYYVRYATKEENVQYKTGVDIGYRTYIAEPCQPTDEGAFRLDNGPRFADIFKPKQAIRADSAATADEANHATSADVAQNAANATNAEMFGSLAPSSYLKVITLASAADNIDTLSTNGAYHISSAAVNGIFPSGVIQKVGSTIYHTEYDLNSGYQLYFDINRNRILYREKIQNVFKPWVEMSGGNSGMLPAGNGSAAYWASLPSGSYYASPSTVSEQPSPFGVVVIHNTTNSVDNTEGIILWQQLASGTLFKAAHDGTTVTSWQNVADGGNAKTIEGHNVSNIMLFSGTLVTGINADGYTANGFYGLQLGNGTANSNFPINTIYGTFMIYGDTTFTTQVVTEYSSNKTWTRTLYNGTWTVWRLLVTAEANGDIIAFKTS